MNPLLAQALGSILRWLLAGAAGWFVSHGIWTEDAASEYLTAVVLAVLALGWSLWQKYRSKLAFLVALDLPAGSTPEDVAERIGTFKAPSVNVFLSLLLAATLALPLAGCAARGDRPHGRADVVNDAVYVSLAALQDQEMSDRALGLVPDDVHREFSRALVPALRAGQALNTALAVWVPGTPLPRDVRTITEQVAALTRIVATTLPDGNPAKARLLVYTSAVQAAVLAFLDSLATTPGGLS